jgi:branched-chain amino acid transport system ATP-binding protein
LLALEGVRAQYGRVAALQGVSLEVHEGEFVSVIGPNGAGKSTMLLSITGVVSPVAGSIRLDGESIVGRPSEDIVRRGVSLVPEGRHIFATLTVGENLLLGSTPRRRSSEVDDDVERLLERFPVLRERFASSAAKLSGGEQQQLAIARALLSRPRLLLLDEPSLGLAPKIVDALFDVLENLHAEGITILLVEQNAAMAVEAADRTYVLRGGKIEAFGTRDELLAMEDFASAYFGFADHRSR